MLHIVLFVLKLLGIILLIILALLLFALLAVLFVPVKYEGQISKGHAWQFYGKIRWLARMFGADIRWENGAAAVSLRILWIFRMRLYPPKEKEQKPSKADRKGSKEKKRREEPRKSPTAAAKSREAIPGTELYSAREAPAGQPTAGRDADLAGEMLAGKGQEEHRGAAGKAADMAKETPADKGGEDKAEAESLWERMQECLSRIKERVRRCLSFFQNLRYTFEKFCAKIANIGQNIQYYIELLQEEETKRALGLCREELWRMARHVLPGKVQGTVRFGLEDPAQTGQLFGLYCAFCQFPGWKLSVEPDFERQVLEGQVTLKGRLRGFVMLKSGWKLWRDQDIRHLIQRLRRR